MPNIHQPAGRFGKPSRTDGAARDLLEDFITRWARGQMTTPWSTSPHGPIEYILADDAHCLRFLQGHDKHPVLLALRHPEHGFVVFNKSEPEYDMSMRGWSGSNTSTLISYDTARALTITLCEKAHVPHFVLGGDLDRDEMTQYALLAVTRGAIS